MSHRALSTRRGAVVAGILLGGILVGTAATGAEPPTYCQRFDGGTCTDEDLERGLTLEDPAAQIAGLDLARRSWEERMRAPAERLLEPKHVLAVRLRAAVVLALHGDLRGKPLVVEVASREAAKDPEEFANQSFAQLFLPEMLGAAAFPILEKRLLSTQPTETAQAALAKFGPEIIPTLVEILKTSTDRRRQRIAISALAAIDRPESEEPLRALMREPDPTGKQLPGESLREIAIYSAMGSSRLAFAPDLAAIFASSGEFDHVMLGYFTNVRYPAVAAILLRKLSRCGVGPEREELVRALEVQTGIRLAKQPQPWEEWYFRWLLHLW